VRLLVVTAVPAERDALREGAGPGDVVIEAVGVGPAAAAAGTARLLARGPHYDAVLSGGIGGGYPERVPVGGVALGTVSIAADLGAGTPDGTLSLDDLGFGSSLAPVDESLLDALRGALPEAAIGPVLTVWTVTGTAPETERLAQRYPGVVAEGMEGFGVATAASQAGVPFAEVRTISNLVGPRDRAAWRIPQALAALAGAGRVLDTLTL
jgi:futalosine hydrolase